MLHNKLDHYAFQACEKIQCTKQTAVSDKTKYSTVRGPVFYQYCRQDKIIIDGVFNYYTQSWILKHHLKLFTWNIHAIWNGGIFVHPSVSIRFSHFMLLLILQIKCLFMPKGFRPHREFYKCKHLTRSVLPKEGLNIGGCIPNTKLFVE